MDLAISPPISGVTESSVAGQRPITSSGILGVEMTVSSLQISVRSRQTSVHDAHAESHVVQVSDDRSCTATTPPSPRCSTDSSTTRARLRIAA
jgi:hypothetical protein